MATYLDRIIVAHRARAAADPRRRGEVRAQALDAAPTRGFAAALRAGPIVAPPTSGRPVAPGSSATRQLAVIAEVKRRSPSKGALAPDLDPAAVAVDYAAGGASCLSVLTDAEWFGGSPADLVAARAACPLPVLRKDFTVDPIDVYDARLMGADAVLLIAAALDPSELADLAGAADDVGLDALVEVHDGAEAEVAVAAGARLVGVNQRDLHTFEVDTERASRVAAALPAGVTTVAESGIRGAADAALLAAAGFDAVLVGESVVTAGDRSGAVGRLRVPLRRAVAAG